MQRLREDRRLNSSPTSGTSTSSTSASSSSMPEQLADVERRAIGRRQQQRAQRVVLPLALEGAPERQRAREGDRNPQDGRRHIARAARPSRTRPNENMSTTVTAKNSVVDRISRLRTSTVRSLLAPRARRRGRTRSSRCDRPRW